MAMARAQRKEAMRVTDRPEKSQPLPVLEGLAAGLLR